MKIMSASDVQASLGDCLDETQEGPVVITRGGKAIAVLLAVADDDDLERLILAHSPRFQEIMTAARKQFEEGLGIPHDEFWRDIAEERVRQGDGVEVSTTP